MPKPKRANGLHFVWGAIFLFEGAQPSPKPMPGYFLDSLVSLKHHELATVERKVCLALIYNLQERNDKC